MRILHWCFGPAVLLLCSSIAYSATITGTVTGPDGNAFRAAFVVVQNAKRDVTVYVLSDAQGRYRIENLPAGQYRLFIRAVGYKANPKIGLRLTASQHASADFSIQKSVVSWSEISGYQGKQLFPHGKMLDFVIERCTDLPFLRAPLGSTESRCGGLEGPHRLHEVARRRRALQCSTRGGPRLLSRQPVRSRLGAAEVAPRRSGLQGARCCRPVTTL